MHITATCPTCKSQYQVDPSLRGKRMRCPNSICRAIFEVTDESPAAAPTAIAQPTSPPVVVPPTPTPVAVAKPVTAPKPAPSWSAPPPVRSGVVAAASPASVGLIDDFPGDDEEPPEVAEAKQISAPVNSPRKQKRSALLFVAVTLAVLVGLAGLIAFNYAGRRKHLETDLATKAAEEFQKGDFAAAARLYLELQRQFPQSTESERYRFLATFSEIRNDVDVAGNDPDALADARRRTVQFLVDHDETPLFKSHQDELFGVLNQLVKRAADTLAETPDPSLLTEAESLWQRARSLATRSTAKETAKENEVYTKTFDAARKSLSDRARREFVITKIRGNLAAPTASGRAEAKSLVHAAKLDGDPQIAKLLAELAEAHKASIAFRSAEPAKARAADDPFPMIPLVNSVRSNSPARGTAPIVTFSPTGVLYALNPRSGELVWSRRLGIDSNVPPFLFDVDGKMRILAISNDVKTAFLLDRETGQPRWQHPLTAAAVASPSLAAGRILIPLANGRIDVLDPATGTHTGSFTLDQPVAAAGTPHPGTPLVTFAGSAHCVYVLDLSRNSCVAIVDTTHAAGAVIGPPIFVSERGRSWHVLTLAEPGPRVRLRPIPYPPDSSKVVEKDIVVNGTLSFPPYHDADSIVLVLAEGTLRQFGIRQPGNADPLLFPLTPTEIALDAPRRGQLELGRIMHVDAENLWVVTAGRLQRLQRVFSLQQGPLLKPRWPAAVLVGEPVHSAGIHVDAAGTILFLTTHEAGHAAARISAFNGETGKLLWQTQLGSMPRGEPIVIGETAIWEDDAGLHAGKLAELAASRTFTPLPGSPSARSVLLPMGKTCLRVGWTPGAAALRLAEFDPESRTISATHDVKLSSPPVAPPIVIDSGLIVALASGVVAKVDLATAAAITGPDWRGIGVESSDSPPHLVRLGPARFVVTDGAGGLAAFDWDKSWKEIARLARIDGAPVSFPRLLSSGEPRLFVTAGDKALVQLDIASLQPMPKRSWPLKGKRTAGPFAVGERIVCIVDGKRLVGFDPASDSAPQEVIFNSDLATPPLRVGNRLVIADIGGNFWTLGPAEGANLAAEEFPALSIRDNLAPATTPIVLPDGRLFVIWSDGTAGVVAIP